MVRRELADWFARMTPLVRGPRAPDAGPDGFFSDVNGAVARWAWAEVPYRPVSYAEDRVLAADVLARGWAKAYRPGAGVEHSHEYAPAALARRAFDEGRALREVYGHRAPAHPRTVAREVAGRVRDDVRWMRARGAAPAGWVARSAAHHALRAGGAALGARADRLPARVRARCSLEGRATFEPLSWPAAA
jgi:rhamnosyltransferase